MEQGLVDSQRTANYLATTPPLTIIWTVFRAQEKLVSAKPSFAQYLLGHASLERPPFFYGYALMWLHLIVGTLLLVPVVEAPVNRLLTSMIVASFCLGVVVYGLVAREYALGINLGSYGVSMSRIVHDTLLDPLLLIAVLVVVLASGYYLLVREYRRYRETVCGDKENTRVPAWISAIMGMITLFLCIFALNLI